MKLVDERFLLAGDVEHTVERAGRHWDWVNNQVAESGVGPSIHLSRESSRPRAFVAFVSCRRLVDPLLKGSCRATCQSFRDARRPIQDDGDRRGLPSLHRQQKLLTVGHDGEASVVDVRVPRTASGACWPEASRLA